MENLEKCLYKGLIRNYFNNTDNVLFLEQVAIVINNIDIEKMEVLTINEKQEKDFIINFIFNKINDKLDRNVILNYYNNVSSFIIDIYNIIKIIQKIEE